MQSLAEFDQLAQRPFVLFLEPPSLDPRITNQSACLDAWLAASPQLARRIIIPADLNGKCATSWIS